MRYNTTMTECYCVCWANCPPRPHASAEKAICKRHIILIRRIRQTTLGTAYSVIFVLGITGMLSIMAGREPGLDIAEGRDLSPIRLFTSRQAP